MTTTKLSQTPPAARTAGSQQQEVGHPLVIPFDDGKYAVIPMGITADDFECLQKTLVLWRTKMVIPETAPEISETAVVEEMTEQEKAVYKPGDYDAD